MRLHAVKARQAHPEKGKLRRKRFLGLGESKQLQEEETMRKGFIVTLALALLATIGANASAQVARPENPWALRVGAIWPAKSSTRNATNDTWFNLGLDYTYGRTTEGNDYIASVDYGNASNINYWALQAIYMWRNYGGSASSNAFSFGVGAGAYILDPSGGGTKTKFGIPIVAEWKLSDPLFLQAKYNWVVSESAATNYAVTAGYRF
jgi:hypothetical protein